MKTANIALINLLSTAREFWLCDLYTITLVDGTILRYTSADVDVVDGGRVFLHTGPMIKRSLTRIALGTAVDALDLTLSAQADTMLSGLPWLQAIINGALDGATVDLERGFASLPDLRVVTNLLKYSEQFDNTIWVKGSSTINANAAVAPNGESSADQISGVSNDRPQQSVSGLTIGALYTASVYAKKGTSNFLRMRLNNVAAWFNLAAGTAGAAYTDAAGIESVGSGWYRCWVKETVDQVNEFVEASPVAADGNSNASGNIYLWGAQLNIGPMERYIKTESTAVVQGGLVGTVLLFSGRVSDTTTDSLNARVIVRSHMELLNTPLPRNLYQPPCGFSLYDSGCGVSRAAFGVNSSVASGSTRQTINCALAQVSGWFAIGELVFTSGANLGVRRTIKIAAVGVVNLAYPLPKAVAIGDTFTIYPGCDKRLTTCNTKFSNAARFRGTPFVPVPETSL